MRKRQEGNTGFANRECNKKNLSVVYSLNQSNEKNLSTHFFAISKFCSASTITSFFSYFTLIVFNVEWYKLNFFPEGVMTILSTIRRPSLRSHFIFLKAVVCGMSSYSFVI